MKPTDALPHPSDWQESSIGRSIEIKRGVSWSKEDEHPTPRDGAVPVIRIGNVQRTLELEDMLYISNLKPKAVEKKRVGAGWSILVGSNGNRARIGNTVFIREKVNFLFASFLLGARPVKDAGFSSEWFFRWLGTERVQAYLTATAEGSTGLSNLSHSFFRSLTIAFPPTVAEQAAIARILDAVDTAIERARSAVDAAEVLVRSLFQSCFKFGLDANGRIRSDRGIEHGYMESEIGLLPPGWQVKRLSEVALVERGKFTPRPRNDPRFYNGPYPFIQTGEIARAKGRVVNKSTQSLNEAGKRVSREFPKGTIMITIAANIGETAILGRPMCAPDSLVGAQVYEPNNPRFIELCLRRLRPRLQALAPRSAQANINLTTLRPLRIPVPHDPDEQAGIALLVDAGLDYRDSITTKVIALEQLKKSLMNDLLTGSVRVPVHVATEI